MILLKGRLIGKPTSRILAKETLQSLSSSIQSVITGIAIKSNTKEVLKSCTTLVEVDDISDEILEAYLDTEEWKEKAGAYGMRLAFIKPKSCDQCRLYLKSK